jgi:hypothetical protein
VLGEAGCEDLIDLGGFSARFARHKRKQGITEKDRVLTARLTSPSSSSGLP